MNIICTYFDINDNVGVCIVYHASWKTFKLIFFFISYPPFIWNQDIKTSLYIVNNQEASNIHRWQFGNSVLEQYKVSMWPHETLWQTKLKNFRPWLKKSILYADLLIQSILLISELNVPDSVIWIWLWKIPVCVIYSWGVHQSLVM